MEQAKNEIWRPTKVNPFYLVSNIGRVKSIDHPIWCKQNNSYSIKKGLMLKANNSNSKKYWRLRIPEVNGTGQGKMYAVHRLVADAFIPNPMNLPQINHIDGNKDNNCVSNLEWCDNRYNQQHAIDTGLKDKSKMSAHSSFRKLTEEQVSFIKIMWDSIDTSKRGEKEKFCSIMTELFNLQSLNTIRWIIDGETNKFFGQADIQEETFINWFTEYKRLYEEKTKKTPTDWARELGINTNSFLTKYRKLGKDINATVSFYKQLYHL